jgi:hypothetical protein
MLRRNGGAVVLFSSPDTRPPPADPRDNLQRT